MSVPEIKNLSEMKLEILGFNGQAVRSMFARKELAVTIAPKLAKRIVNMSAEHHGKLHTATEPSMDKLKNRIRADNSKKRNSKSNSPISEFLEFKNSIAHFDYESTQFNIDSDKSSRNTMAKNNHNSVNDCWRKNSAYNDKNNSSRLWNESCCSRETPEHLRLSEPIKFKDSSDAKSSVAKSVISGLSTQQMKSLRVVIRQSYIQDLDAPTVIQTNLENLSTLAIHHRKGEGEQPLFARKDIVVNLEEPGEERIVSKSPDNECISKRVPSRSSSKESSRSSPRRRSKRSTSKDDYLDKRYSDISRKRVVASEYPDKESHHREHNRRSSRDRGSTKLLGSNSHRKDRDSPLRRYDKHRSHSRSPKRSGYSRTTVHEKPRSRSPSYRRRSQSPYLRKRSPSPYSSKRRSRSPYSSKRRSRSPYPRKDASRSARRSRTPHDERKRYTSGHRPSHSRKRTPSPYSRRRSRSPSRFRKRSITPPRRDGHSRKRYRSKSPYTHRANSSSEKYSLELSGFKGMHSQFGYYGPDPFWVPGPIPRPEFMPRGMVPPPRGMFRPPPYFIPRPYMPFPHPYPSFRPRFPVDYNRSPQPKITAPPNTSAENTPTVSASDTRRIEIETVEEVTVNEKSDSSALNN